MKPRAPNLLGLVWTAAAGMAIGTLWGQMSRPALSVLVTLAALLLARRTGVVAYAGILALTVLAGHAVADVEREGRTTIASLAHDVPRCSIRGEIAEHAGGLGSLLQIERMECGPSVFRRAGVVIVDPLEEPAGTRVAAEGWIIPFTDDGFDRARHRTGAAAAFHANDVTVIAEPRGVLALAASFRRSLEGTTVGMEPRAAGLLRGLTIGDTRGIDETMEDQFRRTGLAHLVAVSGSNVAIVVAGIAVFVRRTRPAMRVGACGLALLFYVLVVGPEPSVLRAAAMGGVALGGLLVGRRAEPLQALAVAIVLLLALRPSLVSSVGLHLSAAATLGIVLWAGPLAERLMRSLPALVAYALAATLSAQVAVAPIMVIVFGEVSLVAPLANLLAAAAVPPATVLGLSGALLGLVWPVGGAWLASGAGPFAGWIVLVAEWLARPAWAAVPCPAWIGWCLAVLVALGAIRSILGAHLLVGALD